VYDYRTTVHEQRNYELHSGLCSKHIESQFQYNARQILAASSDEKRNLFKSFNKTDGKTQTFRNNSTLCLDLGFLHDPLIKISDVNGEGSFLQDW